MIVFIVFFIACLLYWFFSYMLTEPNVVLSSNTIYWNFQLSMWKRYYSNPQFLTAFFVLIVVLFFVAYVWAVYKLQKQKQLFKFEFESKFLWAYSAIILPLFLSYNALSHDIFNYMFNAKMVLVYGYNPHIKTALDFAEIDSWVRFMHNIHTTAPYGYGWTGLSLIPSFFGQEKFLLTLLFFRVFMLFSVLFLYFALQHLSQTLYKRKLYVHELAIVFLNPLLLLEVVSNYHNDLWMMAPAVLAVSMLLRLFQTEFQSDDTKKKNSKSGLKKLLTFCSAVGLLGLSISVKLVTVLLIPFFIFGFVLLFFLKHYAKLIGVRFRLPIPSIVIFKGLVFVTRIIEQFLPTLFALTLFIPLFTDRSQQFLPWYLTWILVWVPFIKNKAIRNTILVFSFSSLLRYVPWLQNGFEYSDQVQLNQRLITWLLPVVFLFTRIKDLTKNSKKLGTM